MGERGHGGLGDVRLPAPGAVPGGLFAAGPAVAQLLGGVADDADDPAGPAGVVAADVALGVGPAQPAVAAADAEVGAVDLAALLQRPADHLVQTGDVRRVQPGAQGLDAVVVLVGAQVEQLVGLGVHLEEAGVQVPVEAAHAVERQDRVRAVGPVVRERRGAHSPISHEAHLASVRPDIGCGAEPVRAARPENG